MIRHRSPNRGAMLAFDAFMPCFPFYSTDSCFQCDCIFFPSFDWIECHQFTFDDDRIQHVIWTIDLVLRPQMCLNIFRRHSSVAASTNDPFHLFIDNTFEFLEFLILYNQHFPWEINTPKQSARMTLSSTFIDSDASELSIFINSISISFCSCSANSLLHFFACRRNKYGSVKFFPHAHLNMPFSARLASILIFNLNCLLMITSDMIIQIRMISENVIACATCE